MSKLSLMDLAFFIAETEASPKHVAGLLICKRPPGAKAGFAKALYRDYLDCTDVKAPFNHVIDFFTVGKMPYWRTAESVDLSRHVHYHKLPPGQGSREDLYRLVADLHQPMLDRSRPLWEMHVIDGLAGGGFALYQKVHHAYADGVTMSRWMAESMATSADDLQLTPVWTLRHGGHGGRLRKDRDAMLRSLLKQTGGMAMRVLGVGRLAAMLMLESVKLTKNAIALPFVSTARTPLTGQVTSGRQFTAAGVSMKRIDEMRRRTRSTVNHVALTCLDLSLIHI